MSTTGAPESPQVLPPHLEDAPSVPTVAAEGQKPKAHRLKPIHLATLGRAQADATKIIRDAQQLVAADFGVSGEFQFSEAPGGVFLLEQGP